MNPRSTPGCAPAVPGLPPGPNLSIDQQTFAWISRPYGLMAQCARDLGDVFTLCFSKSGPHVFFSDPAALKELFALGPHQVSAGKGNASLSTVLGPYSLFSLDGPAHAAERRVLNPFFSRIHTAGHCRMIHDETVAAAQGWPIGESFPLHDRLLELSLKVMTRLLLGTSVHGRNLRQPLHQLMSAFSTGALFSRAAPSENGSESLRQLVEARAQIDTLIHEEIAARSKRPRRPFEDLLDLLLASQPEDTASPAERRRIADQALTLLAAGHETTATAIGWALYWVDQNRATLAPLFQALPHRDPGPIEAEPPVLLDAVCRETLRLTPVVPTTIRQARVPLRIRNITIPPGTSVVAAIYLTHHREDLYPKPDQFRPERFLERRYSPFEYLPFGGGAHRCIGDHLALLETKAILAALLSRYSFTLAARRPIIPVRRSVTVAPSEGLPMVMTPRH